ncbi:AMP phosphorylase [Nanoarchaeota archaeon]
MKFKVKDMDIRTGGALISIINEKDAKKFDLHTHNHIKITKGKRIETVIVDIAESKKAVPVGYIGLDEEVIDSLKVKQGDIVHVDVAGKPKSIYSIKKKLEGGKLIKSEIDQIVWDIVHNKLGEIEITYFVSGCYIHGLDLNESINLTEAIVSHGDTLQIKGSKKVLDKHCSGGVPGNRTTMIVVPIMAAAGYHMPKTSSRSITSPAGTADTMEVLCSVCIPVKKMKKIVEKIGACIVWGGAMNLAAADDKMIKVRHPLSIDPEGMLLASILAKKKAVNSTHVLIDIPVAHDTKIKTMKQANHLKRKFKEIGHKVGMKIKVIITDGRQPIGFGIGPALEAKDVLYLLKGDEKAPQDLKKKSLHMAGILLELAGAKEPKKLAKEILESGKAYEKMKEIIKAQGGNPNIDPDKIPIGKFTYTFKSNKSGRITDINNIMISKIARIAGAPEDQGAGIYLYQKENNKVKKGEKLLTIYSDNMEKLDFAKEMLKKKDGIIIK